MAAFELGRGWLREASLKRVNSVLMNKRELPEHGTVLKEDINIKDIDISGLSSTECFHISQWATGQESGQHCMLALMEHRRIQRHTKTIAETDAHALENHTIAPTGDSSAAFDMIRRSINLPGDVFSDTGVLQEKLFRKSPSVVLKETLKTLASVAMEKGAMSLNAEQLNLAMKQLRVHTFGGDAGGKSAKQKDTTDAEASTDENVENKKNTTADEKTEAKAGNVKKSHSMEGYRLQILQELIRVYVKQTAAAVSVREAFDTDPFFESPDEEDTTDEGGEAGTKLSEQDLLKHHETLEKHLSASLDVVAENAEKADVDDIERENAVLLSYIRQISAMKGSLEVQLKDFESSRAFLSLGVGKDATTEQIRKAYHAKAIKLHPDKKGGNTEKFQKLQDMYKDLVKQREMEDSCRARKFPEAEEDARSAQSIVADMEAHLGAIKDATVMCGTLGHMNMRWVKKLETFPDMVFPKNINKMIKYVLKNLELASDATFPQNLNLDVLQTELGVQACSAQYLIKPMNTICDKLQQLLASGVSLVSLGRYGKEASNKKSYIQLLEQGVGCGLSVSDHIKDIDSVESQVTACVERIMDIQNTLMVSKYQVMEFTTAKVLIEMAVTVFRSRSINVNMIAELSVLAAVLAADLCSSAQEIVEKVNSEVREEIRKSSQDATTEMENDYNEEDLVNLAKVKEQRIKEDREEDRVRCEAQEARRAEERAQEDAAEDIMDHLSGKIRQLHVQLKLQYVQTLQKVNHDACQYQKKLLAPLLHEFGVVTIAATDKNSTKSTGTSYDGAEEKDRVRVVSLLADFIDRSCLRFRDALLAQREADALHLVRQEVGIPDEAYKRSSLWDHLNSNLGWMSALDRSAETPTKDHREKDAKMRGDCPGHSDSFGVEPQEKDNDKASSSSNTALPKKYLAFFPDYRSRVLYLSVLLDADTVTKIVEQELHSRLKEILLPINVKRQDQASTKEMEKTADLTASLFCALVVQGMKTVQLESQSVTDI